ncbi:hypothetical protein [Lysobacter enzymogenes]|uniref:hypothetical protein n=1 Tax=Lysobacter enzymogenes TaxID=69 RepID=UPI001A97D1F9|nr:hypothetical protein [Lysobacter enzymogenes]QQP94207.1 hypothetical protein JHW38_13070 [Lysobacter enzymogenes]
MTDLLHGDHVVLSFSRLAKLDPAVPGHLHARTSALHRRAADDARDLLDVALGALDHPLPTEQQRGLIERADDELASAQRWSELAANARFCREHPELALQLAGDPSSEDEAFDRAAITTSEPTPRRAKRGVRKPD